MAPWSKSTPSTTSTSSKTPSSTSSVRSAFCRAFWSVSARVASRPRTPAQACEWPPSWGGGQRTQSTSRKSSTNALTGRRTTQISAPTTATPPREEPPRAPASPSSRTPRWPRDRPFPPPTTPNPLRSLRTALRQTTKLNLLLRHLTRPTTQMNARFSNGQPRHHRTQQPIITSTGHRNRVPMQVTATCLHTVQLTPPPPHLRRPAALRRPRSTTHIPLRRFPGRFNRGVHFKRTAMRRQCPPLKRVKFDVERLGAPRAFRPCQTTTFRLFPRAILSRKRFLELCPCIANPTPNLQPLHPRLHLRLLQERAEEYQLYSSCSHAGQALD